MLENKVLYIEYIIFYTCEFKFRLTFNILLISELHNNSNKIEKYFWGLYLILAIISDTDFISESSFKFLTGLLKSLELFLICFFISLNLATSLKYEFLPNVFISPITLEACEKLKYCPGIG